MEIGRGGGLAGTSWYSQRKRDSIAGGGTAVGNEGGHCLLGGWA